MDDWLTKLPSNIQENVLQYKQEKDQWRGLGGKLLLREMLLKIGDVFSLEQLKETPKGKLFFEGADFDFNISHSGEMVVLAVQDNGVCGIDIELHRTIDYSIFERNFTNTEWNTIMNAEDSPRQFFDYWAIKESVIKADGRGFEVLGKTEIVSNNKAICDGKTYHISPIFITDGYSSCVASDREITVVDIFNLTNF
ncbi:MAG: 4'-phosphopantetheinyl transferase superfamily protein [Chitinophagales bacterium]